jgi:hypothetical protein
MENVKVNRGYWLCALLLSTLTLGVAAQENDKPVFRQYGSGESQVWTGFAPSGSNYGDIGTLLLANPSDREASFRLREGMILQPDPRPPGEAKEQAQTITHGVRVRLLNLEQQPLPGIALVLVPKQRFEERVEAVTDGNGYATFLNPKPGLYNSMQAWVLLPGRKVLEFGAQELEVVPGRLSDLGVWTPQLVDPFQGVER